MKNYFSLSLQEMYDLENRYNFIPCDTPLDAMQDSLSRLCLRTVRDIAETKKQQRSTQQLEQNLRFYRDYAVEQFYRYLPSAF